MNEALADFCACALAIGGAFMFVCLDINILKG